MINSEEEKKQKKGNKNENMKIVFLVQILLKQTVDRLASQC